MKFLDRIFAPKKKDTEKEIEIEELISIMDPEDQTDYYKPKKKNTSQMKTVQTVRFSLYCTVKHIHLQLRKERTMQSYSTIIGMIELQSGPGSQVTAQEGVISTVTLL